MKGTNVQFRNSIWRFIEHNKKPWNKVQNVHTQIGARHAHIDLIHICEIDVNTNMHTYAHKGHEGGFLSPAKNKNTFSMSVFLSLSLSLSHKHTLTYLLRSVAAVGVANAIHILQSQRSEFKLWMVIPLYSGTIQHNESDIATIWLLLAESLILDTFNKY